MTSRRIFLGAVGDAGHAFPIIALAAELHRRGHDVTVQTWPKWKDAIEGEGVTYSPAFDFPYEDLKPLQMAVRAARLLVPRLEELRPDVVVSDILTLAPALAGEVVGAAGVTLIPHVDPRLEHDFPIYSIGARLPRTTAGRALWRRAHRRFVTGGLNQGREEINGARGRLGLPPRDDVHTGLSRELCLVATLPHVEYPRAVQPPATHVVGPLLWELPGEAAVAPPAQPAGTPVVLVAPSTAQDPEHRMLRAALAGLADAPVRVIATTNRREPPEPIDVPGNAVLVDWLSYAKTMAHCDVVVSHGGHGTLMRAVASGCVSVVCPATGDMMENAARMDWAGLGVRLPRRLVTPRGVRVAVERALRSRRIRERVGEAKAWTDAHDGTARAADLVEQLAARRGAAVSTA